MDEDIKIHIEQAPSQRGRWIAVSRVVRWLAVLASAGLTGVFLLGLGIAMSEYRPSGASLVQQAIVAFAAVALSMCLSVYLLVRPLRSTGRSRVVYVLLFAAIGSAFALYVRGSWVWDLSAQLLALLTAVSIVTSGGVVVDSVRSDDV